MTARPRAAAAAAAIAAAIVVLPGPAATPRAQDSPIMAAMRDELKRSMAELRLNDEPPPYYIEYEVVDSVAMRVAASLGALLDDTASRSRTLRVEVRVGDYAFDNSGFVVGGRGGYGGGIMPLSPEGIAVAPLDDNYDAMRREIWLATDTAYKRAVSVFARKKAAFQNRAGAPTVPDFSREKPIDAELPRPTATAAGRDWAARVMELSAVFGAAPLIHASEVSAYEIRGTKYYLNSEGSRTIAPVEVASLRVSAEAQADDGMILRDGFTQTEPTLADLSPLPALLHRARAASERLITTRAAAAGEEVTGPVLLEGRAAPEFIVQTLAPLMLAIRAPESDGAGRGGPPAQAQTPPFLNRIGLRVLSDAFALRDTPSLKQFQGRPVAGAYVVDDEGVPAKDVSLVEKGRLVTLLTSRAPQRNLLQSNGHGRSGGVQPGVLQLQSSQPLPAAQLKARYLELLKLQERPFGYIVRGLGEGRQPGGGPLIAEAVRVTADGQETPVRGLRFAAVPHTAFRDLVEASEERMLYNFRVGSTTLASVIVPGLIFEELEIQRTRDVAQRPPVVPAPLLQ